MGAWGPRAQCEHQPGSREAITPEGGLTCQLSGDLPLSLRKMREQDREEVGLLMSRGCERRQTGFSLECERMETGR